MFATCQPGEAPDYVNDTFGQPGHVKCCRGGQCGHGAVYLDTWPSVTQVSGDMGDIWGMGDMGDMGGHGGHVAHVCCDQVYDIYSGGSLLLLNEKGEPGAGAGGPQVRRFYIQIFCIS